MGGATIAEREPRLVHLNYDVNAQLRNSSERVHLEKDKVEPSGLIQQMEHLSHNWQQEGLPQNWADLPHVGFLINTQIGFLNSTTWEGLNPQERIDRWTETTEFSLRGWVQEYLKEGLVFLGQLSIEEVDGELDLVDSRHGAKRKLSDTISKKERNGAVWNAHVNLVRPFLLDALDGSIAVIASPAGSSGIRDERGEMIDYVDSHYDILQKKGNDIFEYTIRTDFKNSEHREALKRLRRYAGQPEIVLNDESPVESYIESVALFDSSTMPFEVSDVVNVLRDTRFDVSGGSLYAFKNRMWRDVYKDIAKGEELWHYDVTSDTYIKEFAAFAKTEPWNAQKLKEALATTILRLTRYVLKEERVKKEGEHVRLMVDGDYGEVLEQAAQAAGCAGGGRKKAESSSEAGLGEKTLNCKCPFCGEQIDAIIANGKITCPREECGRSAPYDC